MCVSMYVYIFMNSKAAATNTDSLHELCWRLAEISAKFATNPKWHSKFTCTYLLVCVCLLFNCRMHSAHCCCILECCFCYAALQIINPKESNRKVKEK